MAYIGAGITRFNTADDLTVTDDAEIKGDLVVEGTADINSGTIDGVVVGGASAGAGTFTTFTSNGIDDNADSTVITLDSDEDAIIGSPTKTHNAKLTVRKTGGVNTTIAAWTDGANSTGKLSIRSSATVGIGSDGALAFSTGEVGVDTFNERMRIDSGGILTHQTAAVFNESGADADFRVESDSNANMLKVDGGGNWVGVGRGSITAQEALFDDDALFVNGNVFPGNSGGTAGRFVRMDGFVDALYFEWNSGSADVSGVYLDYGDTSWTANSDERLKTNLVPLDQSEAYDFAKTARAVRYDWVDPNKVGSHIGFIAQDWEELYPEVVRLRQKELVDGEPAKGLLYTETVPVLMTALKEAIAKIESLEARVAQLEAN